MTRRRTQPWFSIQNGATSSPKFTDLSHHAFRVEIQLLDYCSSHLTDGHVPRGAWIKSAPPKVRQELLDAGLVHAEPGGGVEVHDYLDYQRSRAEVEAERLRKATAGQLGGLAKAANAKTAPSTALAAATSPVYQTASKNVAHTDTDTNTREEQELLPIAGAMSEPAPRTSRNGVTPGRAAELFDEFWLVYPKRVDKGAARKVFIRLVTTRSLDAQLIINGAKAYAEHVRGTESKFIKGPERWLNAEGWDDEAPAAQARSSVPEHLRYEGTIMGIPNYGPAS